jgi:hypothetical protein
VAYISSCLYLRKEMMATLVRLAFSVFRFGMCHAAPYMDLCTIMTKLFHAGAEHDAFTEFFRLTNGLTTVSWALLIGPCLSGTFCPLWTLHTSLRGFSPSCEVGLICVNSCSHARSDGMANHRRQSLRARHAKEILLRIADIRDVTVIRHCYLQHREVPVACFCYETPRNQVEITIFCLEIPALQCCTAVL